MSLDVWLTIPNDEVQEPEPVILIRENGTIREISREEWNQRYPGREPVTVTLTSSDETSRTVYDGNITHNLNSMADAAGLYQVMWRPEELGFTHAGELIDLLEDGLVTLKGSPDEFREFNPSNGWGDYEGLVRFVEEYLHACKAYPQAEVHASR